MTKPQSLGNARRYLFAYALIFTFLFLTHAFLLRLPYFWDEAGYYIPAARDLLLTGSLIPHTTLSNAHPPLVMLWLAFWWKFSAFTATTTREAMLMVAAFALLGLYRLSRDVTAEPVAIATTLCTALYPVFFTQSSMAHLDMMAAAFTFWGLAMYVERRPIATIIFFSLAPLAKETALVTPMALMAWELLRPLLKRGRQSHRESWFLYHRARHALSFLICLLPLMAWLSYHHHRTGYFLGNPAYLQYNLLATLNPLRIALALQLRLWHVFGYLNLFLLTLGMIDAMTHDPLTEADGTLRPRIAINVQLAFLVVLVANVVAESVSGRCGAGALHAAGCATGDSGCDLNHAQTPASVDVVRWHRGGSIRGAALRSATVPDCAGGHAALSRLRSAAQACCGRALEASGSRRAYGVAGVG